MGTGSLGEDLSGPGKPQRLGLRGTYEAWLDSQEAWECAAVEVRLPRDEHARTWWLLLGDFGSTVGSNLLPYGIPSSSSIRIH